MWAPLHSECQSGCLLGLPPSPPPFSQPVSATREALRVSRQGRGLCRNRNTWSVQSGRWKGEQARRGGSTPEIAKPNGLLGSLLGAWRLGSPQRGTGHRRGHFDSGQSLCLSLTSPWIWSCCSPVEGVSLFRVCVPQRGLSLPL